MLHQTQTVYSGLLRILEFGFLAFETFPLFGLAFGELLIFCGPFHFTRMDDHLLTGLGEVAAVLGFIDLGISVPGGLNFFKP